MKLVPARTYRDVLWNRMHHPPAMRWWTEKVRIPVLRRDGYRCTDCKGTEWLQVHHDSYQNLCYEDQHLGDLRVLCKACHARYKGTKKRRFWR